MTFHRLFVNQGDIAHEENQGRIGWIDMLKCFTMVLVIIGHCTYFGIQSPYGGIDYDSGDCISPVYKLLCFAVQFIYSFHMPLFMFASGMCFCLVNGKSVSFGSFARKKAKRLLVPFVLTTTFISVPLKYIAGYWSGCQLSFLANILPWATRTSGSSWHCLTLW